MSVSEFNRNPVDPSELVPRYVDGKPAFVPPRAVDCPVLSLLHIEQSAFADGVAGGQMNLLHEAAPMVGRSRDERSLVETRRKMFTERAEKCAAGTCAFMGQTATCWRRENVQLQLDTTAE